MQTPVEPRVAGNAGEAVGEEELPLIDHRTMSDWTGDMDRDDVVAILARVPEEAARSLTELRRAIEAKDAAAARRTAHRLKGMANNLGAVRLARMARAVELSSQSIDDVSDRMPVLERTLGETLAALRAYC
jgi:HPt (histidine-containing phosphotransfer) domain-containing protein